MRHLAQHASSLDGSLMCISCPYLMAGALVMQDATAAAAWLALLFAAFNPDTGHGYESAA